MKKEFFAIRLDPDVIERLKDEAYKKGINVSDLVREKLNYGMHFPEPVKRFLDDYAKKLNFSCSQVLEAIVIDYMARHDARVKIWPKQERLLLEFIRTEKGPYKSQMLYDFLFNYYKNDYEKEKEKLFFDELNRYLRYDFGEEKIKDLYRMFGYDYEKTKVLQKKKDEVNEYIQQVIDTGWINEDKYDHTWDDMIYQLYQFHKKGLLTEDELIKEIKNLMSNHEKGELI